MHDFTESKEKAVAIAIGKKGFNRDTAFEHLNEIESLADTAGAVIIEKIYQELDSPNKATVIGKGKVEEIQALIEEKGISLIIFEDDISPTQMRNLENTFQVKVVDRSGLILDIFAKHARSLEAKVQVELAQSQYLLPRLTRMWTHLSKQYGGIRTKGPGETQIETDRRMLKIKIQKLKEKLEDISVQREQQRKGRKEFTQFALVGYTNAGKSTLMNSITDANVYVEDKLFATLDTTVRSFNLPGGAKSLISDTVGFIRKLPVNLIASFRTTLAEAEEADILIHVVDVSHKFFREHIKTVNETLESLKISQKPTILVLNKVDLIEDANDIRAIESEFPMAVFTSASRNINIQKFLSVIQEKSEEQSKILSFILPYTAMELISEVYSNSDILSRDDNDEGICFKVRVKNDKLKILEHNLGKYLKK
ncbi:MAG: GTPase HflX [Ignavibacteriae bacterium]|nr:GTPase HflX [Ignavibacteriota bacterium]